MPTPAETVRLLVGGYVHDDWESYDIDSDLITPADQWHVRFSTHDLALPSSVQPGAGVEIHVGDDLVMAGRIDDIDDESSKLKLHVSMGGRDAVAALLDCSAPIVVAKMASLEDIMAKIVVPLGVTKYRIDADAAVTRRREKINVEPGDTAWEVLANAAEANGLWPWVEPDGTLVIGGPDYTVPPVATLIERKNGEGNNVIRLRRKRSIHPRYSEVTVLGQAHGTRGEAGRHNLKAVEKDSGVSWYRPKVVVDHEADTVAVCRDRARKLLADSRLKGLTWSAEVKGHRILAPGQPGDGKLWSPMQRVRLISELREVDEIVFLMARKFTGGRSQGPRTHLTLKEDKAWVLDAHPHKRKHRLGKNSAPLQIIDASKGAAQ